MSKEMTVIALGVWLIVLTQLGIPGAWKTILLVLTGLGLMVLGFLLRTEATHGDAGRTDHGTFVENGTMMGAQTLHEQKSGIHSLN